MNSSRWIRRTTPPGCGQSSFASAHNSCGVMAAIKKALRVPIQKRRTHSSFFAPSRPFMKRDARARMMSANTARSSDIDVMKRLFGFSRWSRTLAPGRSRSQTPRSRSRWSDVAAFGEGDADRGSLLSHDDDSSEHIPLGLSRCVNVGLCGRLKPCPCQ